MPYRRNNYDFVIDSSFTPFTMQEMLMPFMAYKDAYEKDEAAYIDLQNRADKFKYLSETLPEGSKARQIYEGYANQLSKDAQDFMSNGKSMSNARSLLDLKRRYQGEIGRLYDIDAIRRAQIKEQNDLRLKDPTRLFSRRADMTSFDDYLNNPDLGYESYSGAMLAQQVGTAASAIAKGLNEAIRTGKLDNYTNTWIESHGYNVNDVRQAMLDPSSDKTGVLSSIVREAVESSGIPKWGNPEIEAQAYRWANQGLWQAIGQSQIHTFEDYGTKLAAQEASQMRMADYNHNLRMAEQEQAARLAQQQSQQQGNSLAINPVNIYSQKEANEASANMKNFAKYFDVDANGHVKMNKKGFDEYNRNAAPKVSASASGGGTARLMNAETQLETENKYQPTEFKKFIDSLGGSKYFINGKMQPGNLGNLWAQYNKDNASSKYDATKSTEFDYTISSSQQKDMKSAIQIAARGTELQEVDFDRKTNSFKPAGKAIKMNELNSDDVTVVSTRFSPYGNTVMIKDKNGDVHRYLMPGGINPYNEKNRDTAMQKALEWQNVVTSGKYNGIQASPEEIAYAQNMYKQALQEAYLYHSQLGLTNKTKEQEYNPYGY